MASIWVGENKKGSGIWYIWISTPGGKIKKISAGRDKKKAEKVAEQLRSEQLLGRLGIAERPEKTFAEYAAIWEATIIPASCKPSTVTDYRGILKNHLIPVFGARPVKSIRKMEIKTFLLEKSQGGLAQSTVVHIKNALAGVLNLAMDDEAITTNPAHRLGKVFTDSPERRKKIVPPTREEVELILEQFRAAYPEYYHLVLTLARTGCRLGEAMALRWEDINFADRFVMVRQAFSRGKINTPKNHQPRSVDMSNQLAAELAELLIIRKAQTLKNGWKQVPEWLFINSIGKPVSSANFRRRAWDLAITKAELKKIRIHDLRHAFASQLINAGWPLAYIKEKPGHHSIKVTVDIYGHLAPEGNKQAVNSLDPPDYGKIKKPPKGGT